MNIGDVVNNHIILERLGGGAYGDVFKVQNTLNHDVLALKVAKNNGVATDLARFELENEILRNLSPHRNILGALSKIGNHADDKKYYLMELADIDLINYINSRPILSFGDSIRIFEGIINGLGHAHSKNIFHRDLHFENVLMKIAEAKLTDFGRGKDFNSKNDFTSKEPCWGYFVKPPEIDFNIWKNPTNKECELGDIYALGIILFFLFDSVPRIPILEMKSDIEKYIRQHISTDPTHNEHKIMYEEWLLSPWAMRNPSLKLQLNDENETLAVNHLLDILTNVDFSKRVQSVTLLKDEIRNLNI